MIPIARSRSSGGVSGGEARVPRRDDKQSTPAISATLLKETRYSETPFVR